MKASNIVTAIASLVLCAFAWDIRDDWRGLFAPSRTAVDFYVHEVLKEPLNAFRSSVGRFPTTEEGLAALIRAPKGTEALWHGPYVTSDRIPPDPWNRAYQYSSPGTRSAAAYDVWSLGPDGVPSADDVGNWSK